MKTETAARKSPSRSSTESGTDAARQSSPDRVAPEVRYRMIAAAAYLRAEQRAFQNGSPEDDWLQAEIEVDEFLEQTRRARSGLDTSFDEPARRRSGS
jgi:Protein of unknown function (DUF2934)